MKTISFLITIVLYSTCIMGQEDPVKAFGQLSFGMSKKEASKIIASAKDDHILTIGEFEFLPNRGMFKYDESGGLVMVVLRASPKDVLKTKLNESNSQQLLLTIQKSFEDNGYKEMYKHVYFPQPLLVHHQSNPCLILTNQAKKHVVYLMVPHIWPSQFERTFELWIQVISQDYFDKALVRDIEKLEKIKADFKGKF